MTLVEVYKYVNGLIDFIRETPSLSIAEIRAINEEIKLFHGVMRLMGSSMTKEVIRVHKGEFKPKTDPFSEIQHILDEIEDKPLPKQKRYLKNIRRNGQSVV